MGTTRSTGARGFAAAALVIGLGFSGAARADAPAALFEDGAELLSQARELWAEGTRAFSHGQLEHARLLYLSAYRAQHHWQIAGSLGHTEAALGRHRDAAEHLAVYLRESRDLPNADPRDRLMLAAELARALTKIGALNVTAQPDGAEVLVDGARVGTAPLADPVFVEPGRHLVEARKAGYQPAVERRDLAPGTAADVSLRLAVVAGPRAQAAGPALAPAAPAPLSSRAKGLIIGGAAGSAVLLGMGVGFTAWSNGAAADRDAYRMGCAGAAPTACGRFDDVEQRRWVTGNVAAYSFLGAGVVAVATTAYALVTWKTRRPARAAAAAGPAPGGVSFAW